LANFVHVRRFASLYCAYLEFSTRHGILWNYGVLGTKGAALG